MRNYCMVFRLLLSHNVDTAEYGDLQHTIGQPPRNVKHFSFQRNFEIKDFISF